MLKLFKLLRDFFVFFVDLYKSKYIIYQLVKRDFQNRYLGSFVGFVWVLIQPSVYIFIMWFVLAFGLKPGNVGSGDIPYHLWFISGLVPWLFLSELMSAGTNSIIEYSYLIKKVVFRSSIIPMIKIFSSLIIHFFMVILLSFVFLVSGFTPNIYWIQIPYFLFSATFLLFGFSWLTSSLSVFIKDVPQIVAVLLQVFFWGTPIIWQYQMLPERFAFIYKFNPVFYIIKGYRDSFLGQSWFWQNQLETFVFWGFSLILFGAGAAVFKKLKPHFADVL
ncbi:MAG: ABC transporter permease [Bacteroidetes bacterium]|nr:ABC transporter permease [Bacteroidota bacterium]